MYTQFQHDVHIQIMLKVIRYTLNDKFFNATSLLLCILHVAMFM